MCVCEETKRFSTVHSHQKKSSRETKARTLHTAEVMTFFAKSSKTTTTTPTTTTRPPPPRRRRRRRLAPSSFFAFVFCIVLSSLSFLLVRATTSSSETKSNDHDNTDDDNSNSSKNDIIVEDLTTPREGEVRSTHKMFESESGFVVDSLREDPNMDGETHLDDLLEIGRSVDDFVDDGGPGVPKHYVCNACQASARNWTRTYRKKSLNAREGPSMGRNGRDVLFRRDREELQTTTRTGTYTTRTCTIAGTII